MIRILFTGTFTVCESFCYTEALGLLTKRACPERTYSNEHLSLGVPVNSNDTVTVR
jgi:hypothetical protein